MVTKQFIVIDVSFCLHIMFGIYNIMLPLFENIDRFIF
jgi:hypothetical protein